MNNTVVSYSLFEVLYFVDECYLEVTGSGRAHENYSIVIKLLNNHQLFTLAEHTF
jgi:hypothetical protein